MSLRTSPLMTPFSAITTRRRSMEWSDNIYSFRNRHAKRTTQGPCFLLALGKATVLDYCF